MQNRFTYEIERNEKTFPVDFCAKADHYTQIFEEKNTLHYHNCLEIGYCESGNGVEFIENDIYPFHNRTVTVIKAGAVHDSHIVMSRGDVPSNWRFIFVDTARLEIPFPGERSLCLQDTAVSDLFLLLFSELENHPDGDRRVFVPLLSAFLGLAFRTGTPEKPLPEVRPMEAEISQAVNCISRYYQSDITVAQLAETVHLSESSFRLKFRKSMGCSPLEYINNLRISVAGELLRSTGSSVLQISQEVGFATLSSFNRQFKKRFGASPREIRRGNRMKSEVR